MGSPLTNERAALVDLPSVPGIATGPTSLQAPPPTLGRDLAEASDLMGKAAEEVLTAQQQSLWLMTDSEFTKQLATLRTEFHERPADFRFHAEQLRDRLLNTDGLTQPTQDHLKHRFEAKIVEDWQPMEIERLDKEKARAQSDILVDLDNRVEQAYQFGRQAAYAVAGRAPRQRDIGQTMDDLFREFNDSVNNELDRMESIAKAADIDPVLVEARTDAFRDKAYQGFWRETVLDPAEELAKEQMDTRPVLDAIETIEKDTRLPEGTRSNARANIMSEGKAIVEILNTRFSQYRRFNEEYARYEQSLAAEMETDVLGQIEQGDYSNVPATAEKLRYAATLAMERTEPLPDLAFLLNNTADKLEQVERVNKELAQIFRMPEGFKRHKAILNAIRDPKWGVHGVAYLESKLPRYDRAYDSYQMDRFNYNNVQRQILAGEFRHARDSHDPLRAKEVSDEMRAIEEENTELFTDYGPGAQRDYEVRQEEIIYASGRRLVETLGILDRSKPEVVAWLADEDVIEQLLALDMTNVQLFDMRREVFADLGIEFSDKDFEAMVEFNQAIYTMQPAMRARAEAGDTDGVAMMEVWFKESARRLRESGSLDLAEQAEFVAEQLAKQGTATRFALDQVEGRENKPKTPQVSEAGLMAQLQQQFPGMETATLQLATDIAMGQQANYMERRRETANQVLQRLRAEVIRATARADAPISWAEEGSAVIRGGDYGLSANTAVQRWVWAQRDPMVIPQVLEIYKNQWRDGAPERLEMERLSRLITEQEGARMAITELHRASKEDRLEFINRIHSDPEVPQAVEDAVMAEYQFMTTMDSLIAGEEQQEQIDYLRGKMRGKSHEERLEIIAKAEKGGIIPFFGDDPAPQNVLSAAMFYHDVQTKLHTADEAVEAHEALVAHQQAVADYENALAQNDADAAEELGQVARDSWDNMVARGLVSPKDAAEYQKSINDRTHANWMIAHLKSQVAEGQLESVRDMVNAMADQAPEGMSAATRDMIVKEVSATIEEEDLRRARGVKTRNARLGDWADKVVTGKMGGGQLQEYINEVTGAELDVDNGKLIEAMEAVWVRGVADEGGLPALRLAQNAIGVPQNEIEAARLAMLTRASNSLQSKVNTDPGGSFISLYGTDEQRAEFREADILFQEAAMVAPKDPRAAIDLTSRAFSIYGKNGTDVLEGTRAMFGVEHEAVMPAHAYAGVEAAFRTDDLNYQLAMLKGMVELGPNFDAFVAGIQGSDTTAAVMRHAAGAMGEGRERDAQIILEGNIRLRGQQSGATTYSANMVDAVLADAKMTHQYLAHSERETSVRRVVRAVMAGTAGWELKEASDVPDEDTVLAAMEIAVGPVEENPGGFLTEVPTWMTKQQFTQLDDLDWWDVLNTTMRQQRGSMEEFPHEDAVDLLEDGVWMPVADGVYQVVKVGKDGELLQVLAYDGGEPFLLDIQALIDADVFQP